MMDRLYAEYFRKKRLLMVLGLLVITLEFLKFLTMKLNKRIELLLI